MILAKGGTLFKAGVEANKAYVATHGTRNYTMDPVTSTIPQLATFQVGVDSWLCEAVLWPHWIHMGKYSHNRMGIHGHSADGFVQIVQKSRIVRLGAQGSARLFAPALLSANNQSAFGQMICRCSTLTPLKEYDPYPVGHGRSTEWLLSAT